MNLLSSLHRGLGIAGMAGLVTFTGTTMAASVNASDWENEVAIYGWFSDISGTVANGTEWTYDIGDIVDSMEMVFMGNYEGRINKWSFLVDLVYLDVSDDSQVNAPAGSALADADLTTWVVHGTVGYDVMATDAGRMAVVGGVRYLDLELESDLSVGGTQVSSNSGSQDGLDVLVGIRGHINLNNNWFIPYHADIGTGDSDVSYQLFAGVGYQFSWGDIRVGYRYLDIEMDDDKLMSDLTVSGPIAGVAFRF